MPANLENSAVATGLEKEYSTGVMNANILEITKIIKEKEMEYIPMDVIYMMEAG